MLKLYEPQTFLFIESYIGALASARARGAPIVALAGCFLLLFGLPLRRFSAALLLGAIGWALGGILAMQAHWAFTLWSVACAAVAAVVGFALPRFAHAVYAGALVGLVARLGGAYVDEEIALYTLLGGAAIAFVFALVAWHSMPALLTAITGAFVIAFVLPLPALAHDDDLLARTSVSVVLMIFGLWLQFRIEEITWNRLKTLRKWKRHV